MGEALPFMLPRLDAHAAPDCPPAKLQALARPIICGRTCTTPSPASISRRPSRICWREVGVERIMFSADYPYGSMAEAREFLEQLPMSAPTANASRTATPRRC